MRKNWLESKMKIFGDTQSTLAEALGITVQALNAKMNGRNEFTRSEIQMIKERYHLTAEEVDFIFFTQDVSCEGTTQT